MADNSFPSPVGQAAKTPPSHGGNGSSILPRVTKAIRHWSGGLLMEENRTRQFRFSHGSPKPSDIGRVAFFGGGKSNSTVQILPRVTKAIRHWSGGFSCLEEIELDSSDSPTGHQSHPIFIGWLLFDGGNRTRQFRFSHGSPKPSDTGRVAFIVGGESDPMVQILPRITKAIRYWSEAYY